MDADDWSLTPMRLTLRFAAFVLAGLYRRRLRQALSRHKRPAPGKSGPRHLFHGRLTSEGVTDYETTDNSCCRIEPIRQGRTTKSPFQPLTNAGGPEISRERNCRFRRVQCTINLSDRIWSISYFKGTASIKRRTMWYGVLSIVNRY